MVDDIFINIEENNLDINLSDEQTITTSIEDSTPIDLSISDDSNIDVSIADDSIININIEGGSGGSDNFLNLTDTPNSYSGKAGYIVKVNGTEDALEFTAEQSLSGYVPYTGATTSVDLGNYGLSSNYGYFDNSTLVGDWQNDQALFQVKNEIDYYNSGQLISKLYFSTDETVFYNSGGLFLEETLPFNFYLYDVNVSFGSLSVNKSWGGYTFPNFDGTVGQIIVTDGAGNLDWSDPPAVVSGNDTEVQFNDAGSLGSDSDFTYNKTNNELIVAGLRIVPNGTSVEVYVL